MTQVNVLETLIRQVRLRLRTTWLVLELSETVSSTQSLLVTRNLALLGLDYGTKFYQSTELGWDFSLVDAFDVLVQQVLLFDVDVLLIELLFRRLPLVELMRLPVAWQDLLDFLEVSEAGICHFRVDVDEFVYIKLYIEHVSLLC